jgi:hypothetical protein
VELAMKGAFVSLRSANDNEGVDVRRQPGSQRLHSASWIGGEADLHKLAALQKVDIARAVRRRRARYYCLREFAPDGVLIHL